MTEPFAPMKTRAKCVTGCLDPAGDKPETAGDRDAKTVAKLK